MNKLVNSQLQKDSRLRSWFVPHKIPLLIAWLVTTISSIVILIKGIEGTTSSIAIRQMLHVLYVAVLIWYLARTGPSLNQLPKGNVPVKLLSKIGAWLSVGVVVWLCLLNIVSADGIDLLIVLSLVASVVVLLVWLRSISLRLVIQAIAVALLAYLVGSQWVRLGLQSKSWNDAMCAFTVLFYITGGLLLMRTGLGSVQLLKRGIGPAVKSVFMGCLLFVPLGLINALTDPTVNLTGIREWWMPALLPLWSGVYEETWFRLFLIGLIFFLLRPAFHKYQSLAVIAAVLFSAITFGVGHGRDLENFLTTGLLYGGSFAVVFIKRDWEYAVGAHYMVNMIQTLFVFLMN